MLMSSIDETIKIIKLCITKNNYPKLNYKISKNTTKELIKLIVTLNLVNVKDIIF